MLDFAVRLTYNLGIDLNLIKKGEPYRKLNTSYKRQRPFSNM